MERLKQTKMDDKTTLKGKKIATLNVYLDESTEHSDISSAVRSRDENGVYELWLRPFVDGKILKENAGYELTTKGFQTIVAHELGHFLAMITLDPTHSKLAYFIMGQTVGERKAWKLANEIKPDLDKGLEKIALDQAEKVRGIQP
jgi:hypothetical protein